MLQAHIVRFSLPSAGVHRNSSMLQAHIVRFSLPSAGDTPPFIYVASNLGKQISFAGFSLCLFEHVEVTKTKIQPSIDIATKAFLD
jgi:hypothetical protein